jgi:hypothetical protein
MLTKCTVEHHRQHFINIYRISPQPESFPALHPLQITISQWILFFPFSYLTASCLCWCKWIKLRVFRLLQKILRSRIEQREEINV